MDANGQRFWLLADERHWTQATGPTEVEYDTERRHLRLARRQPARPEWSEDEIDALSRLDRVPSSIDAYGTRARWDEDAGVVVAEGAVSGAVVIYTPPANSTVTDVAVGHDDILYLAVQGDVVLIDLRGRWDPTKVTHPDVDAWRLAPDPAGGTWVLDGTNARLARLSGEPLPTLPHAGLDAGVARPCEENPNPPSLTVYVDAVWPADQIPVAIACSGEGRLALLTWGTGLAHLHLLDGQQFASSQVLNGVANPFSMAWATRDRVGVLLAGINESPVYVATKNGATVDPVGDIYPLRGHDGGPFLHGVTLPPHYPTPRGSNALHKLSLPVFAREGTAVNATTVDSGSAQTEWHRLYLEANIPPRCTVFVLMSAVDSADAEDAPPDEWYEHRFGVSGAAEDGDGVPQGAWVSSPSEIPFHDGLLQCERRPGESGLFTVLIQRSNRRVRTLRGRYLRVRVRLAGDGRSTPEVTALRAYASRFSYLDQYLPRLYRESLYGAEANDEASQSTAPDFLARFLGMFESVLTPLEDRIASSYLVTDARTAPGEALDWLATWIGLTFEPGYPEDRKRALLKAAPYLYRWRGTLTGIRWALEIATDGGVSGGEIIVLEDFRLRRTFATILGADLADEDDPLLAGVVESGNSFVGETLFLGDENLREFLALFAADLLDDDSGLEVGSLTRLRRRYSERRAVELLFERLAHRLTVLVHEQVTPQDLGLIRQIVDMESPAHVESKVLSASAQFLVGMASLVGVDTYLGPEIMPRAVRLGTSHLGVRDVVTNPGSLDPRHEGGW